MRNPRITPKEQGLIKGALRRVFSRSEIRRKIITKSVMPGYIDVTRPRVKTWCLCAICGKPNPKSYMVADHLLPVININETLSDLDWNTLIDRLWCEESNLQAVDTDCHKIKTKEENKLRRAHKKVKLKKLS